MDLTVLNTDFDAISVIDEYRSFIWTDRYYQFGDFELYTSMRSDILDFIKTDYYIVNNDTNHVMIVEKLLIKTDVEEGNTICVTGRSLESILTRRIVWGQRTISGNFQNAIRTLLNECIINPVDTNRKINNFVFKSTDDPNITSLTINRQYTGDNLYDIIQAACEERQVGFKITINDQKQFVFELYSGTDRSYSQNTVPYVIFSPKFENIINSNYLEAKGSLKNVALIGGEGEGQSRRYITIGSSFGLNRRELFVDARWISSKDEDGNSIPDQDYLNKLVEDGSEKLSENTEIVSFEGKVETSVITKYGEDFFDGDIVQIENEYGHASTVRVIEIVMVEDNDGVSVYPTFRTLTEG